MRVTENIVLRYSIACKMNIRYIIIGMLETEMVNNYVK